MARSLHRNQLNNVVYVHFAKQEMGPGLCTPAFRADVSELDHSHGHNVVVRASLPLMGALEVNSRLPNASCRVLLYE